MTATNAGISKVAADKAIKALSSRVTRAPKKGEKVTLVGFGSFEVFNRARGRGAILRRAMQ